MQDDVQPISFCKEIERCDNGNLKNVKFNLVAASAERASKSERGASACIMIFVVGIKFV